MSKPEPVRPPTPYERFVEATKLIVSVPKKEVDKAMRRLRNKRIRARRKPR
jgi:hypothetical protein